MITNFTFLDELAVLYLLANAVLLFIHGKTIKQSLHWCIVFRCL